MWGMAELPSLRGLEGRTKATLSAEFSGQSVTVHERVARGGQGELYRGTIGGQVCAVKWYYPRTIAADPWLRDRLTRARDQGVPGGRSADELTRARSNRFLWPLDLVVSQHDPALFGYYMPWRDSRFVDLRDVMIGKIQPTFRAIITAGLEMAEAYNELHAAGFCYKDISPGNVALDPDTGEVRICDNDNVDVNGRDGAIGGTPGFMAPEIYHDLAHTGRAQPNAETDRWSLAVLLFEMLVRAHPLEGAKEDQLLPPDEYDLYGPDACFIWNEEDSSNRPTPHRHANAIRFWPILPPFIQKLFTQAFTEGIQNPRRRVLERSWIKALIQLRDSIAPCLACGSENFFVPTAPENARCWSCGTLQHPPLSLTVQSTKTNVVMASDTPLFPHHVSLAAAGDFRKEVARVVGVPREQGAVGLKNLTEQAWRIRFGAQERTAPPNSVVMLHPELQIDFGDANGVIS